MNRERKNGEYYYSPKGRRWGIWRWKTVEFAKGGFGEFVKDVFTKEEARAEVYRLNGWQKK